MTLVMGHWEARGGSQAGPGLERKSNPNPFGDLPSIRISNSIEEVDLVLEISWANECVALAVQVVSLHRGRLP